MKTWYNITHAAEGSTEAEVSIYDAIGGEINAKDFANDLKEIDAETIHLRINSPGGSVIDGIAMVNCLQRHPARIISHIDGLAASMSGVIAIGAADEVHMADNALLMIHNPWTVSMGDADELRADADLLDKMSASILSAYGRSQYEEDELQALMSDETWFTAQEALQAGFIDHIEGGLRAAASEITALAEGSELHVPAEKQIASLTKQLEAVTKASAAVSEELADQVALFDTVTAELVEIKAELETAQAEKIAADEAREKLTEELEAKAAELEAKAEEIEDVKEITEASVAAKAAEIMQTSTVEPVAECDDEADKPLSADEFWAEYKRIEDEHGLAAKNVWYAENKHRKI